MPDSEWFCVETPSGTPISRAGETPPVYRYTNREGARKLGQEMASEYAVPLSVVRYTREELATFTRKVTIEESESVT